MQQTLFIPLSTPPPLFKPPTTHSPSRQVKIYGSKVKVDSVAPPPTLHSTPPTSTKATPSFQVKIYGSKVKVDSVAKVAEIEAAEKKKMLDKVRLTIQ